MKIQLPLILRASRCYTKCITNTKCKLFLTYVTLQYYVTLQLQASKVCLLLELAAVTNILNSKIYGMYLWYTYNIYLSKIPTFAPM